MRRAIFRSTITIALALASPVFAEAIEVTPGVQVTKRSYPGPANEQPFFGFAEKTAAQLAADDSFTKAVIEATGSREAAFSETVKRGWRAMAAGRLSEATARFNQAYLLAPAQSAVYHGFAAIAESRFKDLDSADELFAIARKQPAPLKALNADYGRFLLVAKRPRDALPVLEQAVKDSPDFGDAWTSLAWARLLSGDAAAACVAADEAAKQRPSANSSRDLTMLRKTAPCS